MSSDIDPDVPRNEQGIERPFWQTSDCPKWCTSVHGDGDPIGDRFHFGGTLGVSLSMEAPRRVGEKFHEVIPQRFDADLYQGYRETEPHVTFGLRSGEFGVRLTLREAVEIAHMLIHVTDVAKGAAEPSKEMEQ